MQGHHGLGAFEGFFATVEPFIFFRIVEQVISFLAKGMLGVFSVFEKQRCGNSGHQHHLMTVYDDRISLFYSIQEVSVFFGINGCAPMGTIYMKPKVFLGGKLGNCIQMVMGY